MKFIVDAQLPKSLSDFFNAKGHDSIHTIELPLKNATNDSEIIELANKEDRIVVSKDQDFLESYILEKTPQKLLIVTTGNISNKELLRIFEMNLEERCALLIKYQIIEINK